MCVFMNIVFSIPIETNTNTHRRTYQYEYKHTPTYTVRRMYIYLDFGSDSGNREGQSWRERHREKQKEERVHLVCTHCSSMPLPIFCCSHQITTDVEVGDEQYDKTSNDYDFPASAQYCQHTTTRRVIKCFCDAAIEQM